MKINKYINKLTKIERKCESKLKDTKVRDKKKKK